MEMDTTYKSAFKRFLNYDVLTYKQLTLSTIVFPVILGYYLKTTINSFITGTAGFIMLVVILSIIMIYSVGVKALRNHYMKILLIPNENTDIKKCEAGINYLKLAKDNIKLVIKSDIIKKKIKRANVQLEDINILDNELRKYLTKLTK